MIHISDKANCCGCSACAQKCPKQCITMVEDKEGFLYPKVNEELCIQCGLCEKVCVELSQYDNRTPLAAWAAKNNDEHIREKSSSGGVFSLLSEAVIRKDGVVFGVRFDDQWECTHDYIEKEEDIQLFRGSKYLPSKIGESYKNVEKFLKQGRKVLFSGTPCQIAGLNKFLNKDYSNLYTVEVVCHGVPSPAVWRKYKESVMKNCARDGGNSVSINSIPPSEICNQSLTGKGEIMGVNFRSKRLGWKNYCFDFTLAKAKGYGQQNSVTVSQSAEKNPYMRLFVYNVILRPSCYQCPAKAGRNKSDITVGDFWHINDVMPEYNDDKGVTLVYLNTEKGKELFDRIDCDKKSLSVEDAINKPAWYRSSGKNPFRSIYYKMYKYLDFDFIAQKVTNYRNVKFVLRVKKML